MAASVTYGSQGTGTAASGTATVSSLSFGTAAPDRVIAAHIAAQSNSVPSAVAIGGVSATPGPSATDTGSTPDIQGSWWYAEVPTGTSGNVVITVAGTDVWSVATYRLTGIITAHSDSASNTGSTASIATSSVTIPTNGVGLFAWANNTDTTACTWTNASENFDVDAGIIRHSGASTTTAGTPTVTADGATANQVLNGIAWTPSTALYATLENVTSSATLQVAVAATLNKTLGSVYINQASDTVNTVTYSDSGGFSNDVRFIDLTGLTNAGDLIIASVSNYDLGTAVTGYDAAAGWTALYSGRVSAAVNGLVYGAFWREASGSETVETICTAAGGAFGAFSGGEVTVVIVPAADWDNTNAPEANAPVEAVSATQNPGSISPSWVTADVTAYLAIVHALDFVGISGYPDNNTGAETYQSTLVLSAFSFHVATTASHDANVFTLSGAVDGAAGQVAFRYPGRVPGSSDGTIVVTPGGGSDVNLTLSKTLDTVTSTSTFQVFVTTTLSQTLGSVTSSSALNVLVQLSTSKTLDAVNLSSTLTTLDTITLDLSKTLDSVTSSSTLFVTVGLSLSKTLDAIVSSSTANVLVGLSLDKTLGHVTASSTLAVLNDLNFAKILDPVTLSSDFSGQLTTTLTLSKTLDAVTSSSALQVLVQLSAAKTLDSVVSTATLNVLEGLSLSKTLGSVTSSSTLSVFVGLTLAKTLGDVTLSSDVSVLAGRILTLDKTLDPVTSSASYVSDIQLSLTTSLGGVTLSSILQGPQRAGGWIESAKRGLRAEEIERDNLEVLSIVLKKPSLLME